MKELPSFIGETPAAAEAAAAALNLTIVWLEAPKPGLLPPNHEARVGRQRLRAERTLELLRVYMPTVE